MHAFALCQLEHTTTELNVAFKYNRIVWSKITDCELVLVSDWFIVQSYRFRLEGSKHGKKLASMRARDAQQTYSAIEKWLKM